MRLSATILFFSCLLPLIVRAQTVTTDASGAEIVVFPDGSWRYVDTVSAGTMRFDEPLDEDEELAPDGAAPQATATAPVSLDAEAEERARKAIRQEIDAELARADEDQDEVMRLRKTTDNEQHKVEKLRSSRSKRAKQQLEIAERRLANVRRNLQQSEQRVANTRRRAGVLEQTVNMTIAERRAHLVSTGLLAPGEPINSATGSSPPPAQAPELADREAPAVPTREQPLAPDDPPTDEVAPEPTIQEEVVQEEIIQEEVIPVEVISEEIITDAVPADISTSPTPTSAPVPTPTPEPTSTPPQPAEPVAATEPTRRAPPPKIRDQSNYASYSRERDPRFNPPPRTCAVVEEGVDEFTQQRRRALGEFELFTYTTPQLRPIFKDKSLITAVGRFVSTGDKLTLEVTYRIRSQYANQEFGVLARGSELSFELIGAGKVSLRNAELERGSYDAVDKVFIFNARYVLSSTAEKSLRRELVDKVRVVWGSGFEDYPVYDVAVLTQQLKCL